VLESHSRNNALPDGGLLRAEEVGQGRVLGDGEGRELEAAPGPQERLAPERAFSPDHGTPDHVGREDQGPEERREFEVAARAKPQEIDVLDLRARAAEVEEVDFAHTAHPRDGPLGQRCPRHHTYVPCLGHGRRVDAHGSSRSQSRPSGHLRRWLSQEPSSGIRVGSPIIRKSSVRFRLRLHDPCPVKPLPKRGGATVSRS
jgi:hypothetical protein